MSTTLSVLHVLMAGPGRNVDLPGGGGLVLGAGGVPGLDPALRDFWAAFPCPPPWNHGLLFRVNWTACVGQAVGERLKWFLADRCNIPHDGTGLLPGGEDGNPEDGSSEEEMEAPEACAVPCIIMITLACLVLALLVAGLVFCICRKRPKNTSPSHLSPLNANQDNAKYYTSCHYASAPVMSRPLETALRGRVTETRILDSGGSCSSSLSSHLHQLSPYHQQHGVVAGQQHLEHRPLLTPHHHACNHNHHHLSVHLLHRPPPHQHLHHPHPQQFHGPHAQLLVNLNGQTSVVRPHVADMGMCPAGSGSSSNNYRRLADCGLVGGGTNGNGGTNNVGEYTSTSAASERSHTYESIGEGQYYPDSLSNCLVVSASINGDGGLTTTTTLANNAGSGVPSARTTPQPGGVGLYPIAADMRHTPYSEPEFCDCGCASTSAPRHVPFDFEAALDGYYSDRGTQTMTQTLPLRHFRPVTSAATDASGPGGSREQDQPCPFAHPFSFDIEDSTNSGGGGGQQTPRPGSRQSNGSRRRTSSGSHYSDRSFGGGMGYGSTRDGVQRRNIPALHPNYFDPPEPAAPDTFVS